MFKRVLIVAALSLIAGEAYAQSGAAMDKAGLTAAVQLFGLLISAIVIGPPIAQILRRVGYSPWWVVIAFIPLVNLVALWSFAYGAWPVEAAAKRGVRDWSAADEELFKRLVARNR